MSISETGKKFMLGSLITATGASMLSCDDKIVNESKKNDEILMTSSDVIKSEEDKVAKIDPENMIVILNSETIPTPIPTLEPIPTSTPTPEVIPTQTNPTEVTLIPEIIEQSPCVVIYKGDPDKKEIALTFDDQGENLGKILEVLDAAGVKGTFFLLTSEIKNNPERWQQAVVNGHLICNHSTKHDMSLGSKSEEAIKEDILGWEEAVVEVLGQEYLNKYKEETPYFRTPGGNKTERLLKVLGELGYKYTFYWTAEDCWSMMPENNPKGLTKAQYYANHTKNGAIFLAHGGTWSAVDNMITNIQSKGYEIVTLDQWDDYYENQAEN